MQVFLCYDDSELAYESTVKKKMGQTLVEPAFGSPSMHTFLISERDISVSGVQS